MHRTSIIYTEDWGYGLDGCLHTANAVVFFASYFKLLFTSVHIQKQCTRPRLVAVGWYGLANRHNGVGRRRAAMTADAASRWSSLTGMCWAVGVDELVLVFILIDFMLSLRASSTDSSYAKDSTRKMNRDVFFH